MIGVLGDGFSYIRLEETRDYLWNLLEEYRADLKNYKDQKEQIELDLTDINHISIIERERFVFTEQVKNLVQGYGSFTESIQSLMQSDVNYDNVLASMEQTYTELDDLLSAFS